MKVLQTDFFGDHNIGLYAKASNKFCLVGELISQNYSQKISEVLGAEVVPARISKTEFIGIFSSLNSNGIVLPEITTESEILKLKSLGLNIGILKSRHTATGNLILCNDRGAVVSILIGKKEKKMIENVLGVEANYSTISGIHLVGSCGVSTNKGCLIHRDASEEELKKIGEFLKVKADIGTVNFGSPFVCSGIIANSKGALAGQSTSGPEIARVMEALNLV